METRAQLRRALRAARNSLTAHERRVSARQVARHVVTSRLFASARRVAVYFPSGGELDPEPIAQQARRMGKALYLPVLPPMAEYRLWFVRWRPETRLIRNRFGIPEPEISRREVAKPIQLDLVLMPLVAFDGLGNRLGMGGGFYDRTFAFVTRRRSWHKPRLLGLAYEFQRVERIHHYPWDVSLDGVATEDGVTRFHPG